MDAQSEQYQNTTTIYTQPTSIDELVSLVQSMQKEFSTARDELEKKIIKLESELAQACNQNHFSSTYVPEKKEVTTSRRRLLKKMIVGAAGASTLSLAALNSTPTVQAGTFDFNGTGGTPSPGSNTANARTTILTGSGTSLNTPLLSVENNTTTAPAGTDPNNLPVGIYARSNASFAIYGISTSSGTAPSGVLGVSGSASLISTPFYLNQYGGVVGASNTNPGTGGMSASNVGVVGLSSSSFGVQGVSEQNIGGAFSSSSTNNNRGASLRLGIRDTALGAPDGTAFNHRAGEIYLDKLARVYICNASYTNSVNGDSVEPSAFTLPNGAINGVRANWKLLAPMVISDVGPDEPFTRDQDLHIEGEIWLNRTSGALYTCTRTGAYNNNAMLATIGIAAGTTPTYKSSANNLTLLPTPERFIDTRPKYNLVGPGGTTGPIPLQATRTYQMTGRNGLSGNASLQIPNGTKVIIGNVTVVNTVADGYVTLWPSGPRPTTSTVNFTTAGAVVANAFTSGLSTTGQINAFAFAQTDLVIDVIGYYL